jgi:hypothetical protein
MNKRIDTRDFPNPLTKAIIIVTLLGLYFIVLDTWVTYTPRADAVLGAATARPEVQRWCLPAVGSTSCDSLVRV